MSASNSEKKPKTIITLLTDLYRLYVLKRSPQKSSPPTDYSYDYSYIQGLAMTGKPEKFLFEEIKIPNEELPSFKWILIVIHKLSLIQANKAAYQAVIQLDNLSFDVNAPETDRLSSIEPEIQELRNLDRQIQAANSTEDLEEATANLARLTRGISEYFTDSSNSEVSFAPTAEGGDEAAVEAELQAIDATLAAQTADAPANEISFDLSSAGAEDATPSVDDDLKEIIRANSKLSSIARATTPTSEDVDFSVGSDAAKVNFNDYKKLFSVLCVPPLNESFQEDSIFAYLRVAGPNPKMLDRVSEDDAFLQEVEAQLSAGDYEKIIKTVDSLKIAAKEGRLYKSDYSALKEMENGTFFINSKSTKYFKPKYVSVPIALFAVPPATSSSRSLVPVAIQFVPSSNSQGGNSPLFTPLSGDDWLSAKTIVQMADANYHELVAHLGHTHLVIEPFVLATKRRLPREHPLRILLAPHLEGTILINYGAHQKLIADEGSVDKLLTATIASDRKVAIKGAEERLHNFNDIAFPNTLASRKVDDTDKLPDYPYRDDGLLIWKAIEDWVSSYLKIYYSNNAKVAGDKVLQEWAQELVSDRGGRIKKFGDEGSGEIKTVEYLIKMVSTVIFIASAEHAAVNFPQNELMSYAPAFPLGIYAAPPTRETLMPSLANILPPLDPALEQIGVLYLLGSVHYTKLGQYERGYFKDEKVKLALNAFQKQLSAAEAEIERRNASRPLNYPFLQPSQIPQSINI